MSQTVVIASGKGGVGKSTLTSGLARELFIREKKVLCIDGDVALRSLDIMLDMGDRVVFNWGDVALGNCNPEEAVVKDEIDFLAAPVSFSEDFDADVLKNIIPYYSDKYDYILIDAPAGVDKGFEIAARAAERAIVVTTPDAVCVRSCNLCARELEKPGIEDIKLVINMFDSEKVKKGQLYNIDKCIDETCVQLLGLVPYDAAVVYSSVINRVPGEFSPATRAFIRISGRLCGERIPLVFE